MKSAPHFRSQAVSLARNSCALLRAAVFALAIIIAISVASGPVSARDQANSDNRAGLNGVLHAIAAGSKVSPRVSLRLQVGFRGAARALHHTRGRGRPKCADSVDYCRKTARHNF
jgi:hypothetical protein